jgi:DNA-binding transcriptional ArsR family regulator
MAKLNTLDPLLSNQIRLAVISTLIAVKSAEFAVLMEITQATQGNLSIQLKKLSEAEYILIEKTFKGNYPLTSCQITEKGREAFEKYVENIKKYLHINN